jgi:ferredoxin
MCVKVNECLCPQYHICPAVDACPVGALSQQGFGVPQLDTEKCIDCGLCIRVCTMHVFMETGKMQIYTSRPVMGSVHHA